MSYYRAILKQIVRGAVLGFLSIIVVLGLIALGLYSGVLG